MDIDDQDGRNPGETPAVASQWTKNASRTGIRSKSKVSYGVRSSLQECRLSENRKKLEDGIQSFKNGSTKQRNLKALLYILECLTAKVPTTLSFMTFRDAFDISQSFAEETVSSQKEKKNEFRNLLCSRQYGLCIYLMQMQSCELVILRPDSEDVCLDHLLSFLVNNERESSEDEVEEQIINKEYCQELVSLMDSEWDKCVLRVFIGCNRTNSELTSLGFDSDLRTADKKRVHELISSMKSLDVEAEKMVMEGLQAKKIKLDTKVKKQSRLLLEKKHKWTETQIAERQEEIVDLRERITNTSSFITKDENVKDALSRMIRRKKKLLIKVRRLKKRKLHAGRKILMDEEDERYLAKCITEEKATAHGRRKDTVLYLNHRVKKKHLLKLVNHHRMQRNLPLMKSTTAVYNRSRPKNIRSRQAKRHIGLALYCCKKSPKSEESSNILNHFCRARKKNVSLLLCNDNKDLVHFRSFDDKAYLCPGTKTGMDSTRKQKVLTVVDNELARKFKKYDFPNSMLNITPGVVLYMTKSIVTDNDGTTKLQVDSQDIVVAVKSKYFVGSSGSVWHGHLVANRHLESVLHKVPNEVSFKIFPVECRNAFCKLRDHSSSFLIQTVKEDIMNVGAGDNDSRVYELEKLLNLQVACEDVLSFLVDYTPPDENEIGFPDQLLVLLTENANLHTKTVKIIENIKTIGKDLVKPIGEVEASCKATLSVLDSLGLPKLRPRIVDLTDAGPGVGINNHEAYYRIGQEILTCNYDYYIRIHLAPGDSSQNEVERMQSSVGDAIADGGYVEWEHRKKFCGLSDEEILQMSSEELALHEERRMQHNAFTTCDEITSRIDGNAAPNGYMKAYTSPKKDKLFFWDTEFLTMYIGEKTPSPSAPGYHFYKYVEQFMRTHCRVGEKYLEFIKNSCTESGGPACNFCLENPFYKDMSIQRIPEPIPDYSHTEKFKYRRYDDTEAKIGGELRPVDDYNPRVQLKVWFEEKKISLDEPDQIEAFSKKYIVDKDLVVSELTHLINLNLGKVARSSERKKKKDAEINKDYNDFDWKDLVESKNLKKLKVTSLNKYLNHYDLQHFEDLRKPQKMDAITSHYYSLKYRAGQAPDVPTADVGNDDDNDDSDGAGDADDDDENESDDEVLNMVDDENNEDIALGSDAGDQWEDPSLFTTLRTGRVAGNPILHSHRAKRVDGSSR